VGQQCGKAPERRIQVLKFPENGKSHECDVEMMVSSAVAAGSRPVCNVPCGCAKFCESCSASFKSPECINCDKPIEAKQFMRIK